MGKINLLLFVVVVVKQTIKIISYDQVKRKLGQTNILRLKFLSKYVIRSLSSYSSKYGSTNVS